MNILRAKTIDRRGWRLQVEKTQRLKTLLGEFRPVWRTFTTCCYLSTVVVFADILSSSLKLPFVSKRAVRHGYLWWALNDRSFAKSLLSVLKKSLLLTSEKSVAFIKRNSNETQHRGSIDQWYGRQIKQIKFSNMCLGYIQCTKKVHSQTHRLRGNEVLDNSFRHLHKRKLGSPSMSAQLRPSGFKGVMV